MSLHTKKKNQVLMCIGFFLVTQEARRQNKKPKQPNNKIYSGQPLWDDQFQQYHQTPYGIK